MGFRKHFASKGYSDTTAYDYTENVPYKVDKDGRAEEYIVAIDAIHFKEGDSTQFEDQLIDREILKAYAGFSSIPVEKAKVVTGGWGCGVFNGDLRTKLLIQWIAASLAGKEMVFCPFGRRQMLKEGLPDYLENYPVQQVYRMLIKATREKAMAGKGVSLDIFKLMAAQMQTNHI